LGYARDRVDGGRSTSGPAHDRGRTGDESRDRGQSVRDGGCGRVVGKIIGDRDRAGDRVAPHGAGVVALRDPDASGTCLANAASGKRKTERHSQAKGEEDPEREDANFRARVDVVSCHEVTLSR
jgi:hypothetical protein